MCIQRVDGMKYVSTFFELDFDTPWDHKILKASQFFLDPFQDLCILQCTSILIG